jgi:hypothetical protein
LVAVRIELFISTEEWNCGYNHQSLTLRVWFYGSLTHEETKVFGTPIEVLYKRSNTPSTQLLPFLAQLFNIVNTGGLDEVGIFRLSGSVKQGETMKKTINDGKSIDNNSDVILCASLIKEFLRSMPESLISGTYYDQIMELFSDQSM